jgi:anti-sigma factor RsiW
MIMLHWFRFKRNLSAYRDHSLSAAQFRSLWSHLYHCQQCREEVEVFENLGETLREVPAPSIPRDLAFDVRARLSQERAEQQRPGWLWTIKNQWGHMAFPGAAGLVAALIFFGVFASHFSSPLQMATEDIPLVVRTPARLRDSRPWEVGSNMGDLVVQVLIDPQGRVADYDIVEGSYTPQEARNFRNNMLFAVFDPAMLFGRPTSDTLVLSYRKVRVRG